MLLRIDFLFKFKIDGWSLLCFFVGSRVCGGNRVVIEKKKELGGEFFSS